MKGIAQTGPSRENLNFQRKVHDGSVVNLILVKKYDCIKWFLKSFLHSHIFL